MTGEGTMTGHDPTGGTATGWRELHRHLAGLILVAAEAVADETTRWLTELATQAATGTTTTATGVPHQPTNTTKPHPPMSGMRPQPSPTHEHNGDQNNTDIGNHRNIQ